MDTSSSSIGQIVFPRHVPLVRPRRGNQTAFLYRHGAALAIGASALVSLAAGALIVGALLHLL